MTSYHGGKQRTGKKIAEVIVDKSLDIAEEEGWTIKGYCEPFCGMLGVYQHIPEMYGEKTLKYKAGDTNKSVIMMWNAAKKGWKPPTKMTSSRYNQLKDGPPSAEKGFVGHQYSFGGQFFKGYIAKYGKTGNFPRAMKRVNNIAQKMKTNKVVFKHDSYTQFSNLKDYVIYCDPPYSGGEQWYKGSRPGASRSKRTFDSKKFYEWCRKMAENNIVIVSEYNAPKDFDKIWSTNVKVTNSGISKKYGRGSHTKRIETLYLV